MDALELLSSLKTHGYKEREVTIGEVKIKLASLTAIEIVNILEYSNQFNDVDASISILKIETVARSVIEVGGNKFDPSVVTDQKRQIIKSFGDELVGMLFSQYCELDKSVLQTIEKMENDSLEIEE